MSHTAVLFLAYATTALLWLGLAHVLPYWRAPERPRFAHPWRELGYALAAGVLVILIGQLYVRDIRLPNRGTWRPLTESINQIVIFLPALLLPVVRRQPWSTVWLPRGQVWQRLGVGVALAAAAFLIFALLQRDALPLPQAADRLFSLSSIPIAVQVFLEDVTIALLFVRLAVATSARWAIGITAALFALGHIPTMVANGVAPGEFIGLLRDVALGTIVLSAAWRGADILWFWPVHTTLDLTQFLSR